MNPTVSIHHDDHMQGSKDAAIVLVEYGDYQCPYSRAGACRGEGPAAPAGQQLCFVYRHFPLTDKHPFAELAAEAAEAAAAQGKFWDMHDALFELQPQFGPDLIAGAGRAARTRARRRCART